MPARVYECDPSEVQKLKKLLNYDPYLDPNLIPKLPDVDDKQRAKMSPEEKAKLDELEKRASEASKKLREDRMMNVIFARQDCDLREARSMAIESDKYYLLIRATDEFLDLAEERFKAEFTTIKRAPQEIEQKMIKIKEEEENAANQGFGSIFG